MTDPRPLGDIRAAMRALNCGRTSVYKLLREDPDFPAPIKIGDKLNFFLDEIEKYKVTRPRRRYADRTA